MPAKLVRNGENLELNLSGLGGGDFADALAKVKDVPGRRFNGDRKIWELPADPFTAERVLHSIQPEVSPELVDWIRAARQTASAELVTPLPGDAKLQVPWAETLYPYQRAAVDTMAEKGRMILADDMGLGKTFEAISAVAEYELRNELGNAPKLVASPNSVKGVWARELAQWLEGKAAAYIIDATTIQARHNQLLKAVEDDAWAIVNWEQARAIKEKVKLKSGGTKTTWRLKDELFGNTHWRAIVGDEAHRIKNRKAQVTRGMWKIEGDVKFALTGTPLMNTPDELWSILKWLWPSEYTSYWRFYETYVEYYEGYFGKVITGVKNPDALRYELTGRLIRRTKGEVLDLPEKTRVIVPVPLKPKQQKLYNKAESEFWFEVEKKVQEGDKTSERLVEAASTGNSIYTIPNGAARSVRMRQVASTPALLGGDDDSAKLDAAVEIILDAQPNQFVVFSEFVETCNILVQRLKAKGLTAEAYTGEVTGHNASGVEIRTQLENDFQAGKIDVLVGTIGAMREGITLHASSNVLFIERHWTPGWNEQAEDRTHRVGQKNPVTITILQAINTVDDNKIHPTNKLKERIVESVIPKDVIHER